MTSSRQFIHVLFSVFCAYTRGTATSEGGGGTRRSGVSKPDGDSEREAGRDD